MSGYCYRVIAASINIHAGVLRVNPSQARARMHRLTPLGEDRYDVRDPPVCFKRGEVFELEGELPKALVQSVGQAEGLSKVEEWHPKPVEARRKQK